MTLVKHFAKTNYPPHLSLEIFFSSFGFFNQVYANANTLLPKYKINLFSMFNFPKIEQEVFCLHSTDPLKSRNVDLKSELKNLKTKDP